VAFIEEVLRLEPPAAGVWRVATADTELGGVRIPAGSAVHVRLAAANRDEARFARADELAIDRTDREIRAHLAFGYGAHACIGMLLARRELEIGFAALLSRLPHLRLGERQGELRHVPSFMIRGLSELHLAFDREG
jgi:cytochrome P450